jgi:hypothetical protein
MKSLSMAGPPMGDSCIARLADMIQAAARRTDASRIAEDGIPGHGN